MSAETAVNRQKRKLTVKKQTDANRERLNRIRARKGLPLIESSSSEDEEEQLVIFFLICIFYTIIF